MALCSAMDHGFNSDILVKGISYHVQTEDWGDGNPFIVTRIFKGGAVVKSVKTAYQEIWKRTQKNDRQAIRLAMQLQHQEILDQLTGSYS